MITVVRKILTTRRRWCAREEALIWLRKSENLIHHLLKMYLGDWVSYIPHLHSKKMGKYEKDRWCILEDVEIDGSF
jgi:hypothetical protein